MSDESERTHPQSNAVRRQRALRAIRMRAIHGSWLEVRIDPDGDAPAAHAGVARKPTGR